MEGEILVTGANGFLGNRLVEILIERGHKTRKATRGYCADTVSVGDINGQTDWQSALINVDVVIHTAARVHVMFEQEVDPIVAFRSVNVEGTLNLARQAFAAGVKRFIFISSIKVNGEKTIIGRPFCADDTPAPSDPYGISKHEAEQGLLLLSQQTGLDVVIIRPPLVYGSGVKANFRSMMLWLRRRVPLPLGLIKNQRSLVFIDNLIDLIVVCSYHSAAKNQIFLVSDGHDLSTTDLLRRMGRALDAPARLLAVPSALIIFLARMLGKGDVAERLCESLQVDISKTQNMLGWSPVIGVDEALYKTARGYYHEKNL